MIVIGAAPSGEQDFPLDDLIAGVLGVDDQVGRLGDDDAIPEHGDAERRAEVRAVVEDLGGVGGAIGIGVFENDDAVAVGTQVGLVAQLPPVVDGLEHPDAPALVDGDVGRIGDRRLGRPEGDAQAWSRPEIRGGLRRRQLPDRTAPFGRGDRESSPRTPK